MHIDSVTLGGQTIRYAQGGPEDARHAMLLFNGIGANVETAATFMRHFANTRIITFDVPGVGGSPTPLLPYRFSNLSRLSVALLDHLGVKDVDVFGVSWGGGLAQQFAYDFPDRTSRLILAATTAGFVMVPGSLGVIAKMATPKRYANKEFMARIGPEIYGGLLRENQELMAQHLDAITHSSPRGYLYQLTALSGWTSWHWLPRLTMPTLVIAGTDDPIVPEVNGKMLAMRIPNAEFVTMECGHLFIITLPEETASLVETFLDKAEQRAA